MKAMVYTEYGSPDVLQVKDIAKPQPKDDGVLVKVHTAALNAADAYLLEGTPFFLRFDSGLQRPKRTVLGADIAGVVEAVGKNVTRFKVGDAVLGDISSSGWGGFAEYATAQEKVLVSKPANISFVEAAAVPMASVTALQGLRTKGQIQAGENVLIYGASGGVGTFALQLAKALGARITAVCSTGKIEMVRGLGADHVIDYTKEDFTKNGQQYDLILAANGNRSIFDYKKALTPQGRYVMTGGSMTQIFQALLLGSLVTMGSAKKMMNLMALPSQDDLAFVAGLIEAGKVRPVVDKCYPLAELPQAMRYLQEGHAKGKIVITML